MKRTIVLCLMMILLVGCGSNSQGQVRNITTPNKQTVNDVIMEQMSSQVQPTPTTTAESTDAGFIANDTQAVSNIVNNAEATTAKILEESHYSEIDEDLTQMNSVVVYSEVYNMLVDAPSYVGKVVKMKGYTNVFIDPNTRKVYYACIIMDATACCAQGIEFILSDEYDKYKDYPLQNEEITIVGVVSTYLEGGTSYLTLKDAELVKE